MPIIRKHTIIDDPNQDRSFYEYAVNNSYACSSNATLSLWEENLEQLSADEEERNWEDELEVLSARLQEPVNINTATKRQLEEFPFLTDIQIENILAYVYINGQMQTLYELQLVAEMDRQTIELLLPFVCIKTVEGPSRYPSLKRY